MNTCTTWYFFQASRVHCWIYASSRRFHWFLSWAVAIQFVEIFLRLWIHWVGVFPGCACQTSALTQWSFWSICISMYLTTCSAHLHSSLKTGSKTSTTPVRLRIYSFRTLSLRLIPSINLSILRWVLCSFIADAVVSVRVSHHMWASTSARRRTICEHR